MSNFCTILFCVYFQDSGLYEYITFGTLDGVRPDICHQVYCDFDYRKIWDSYVKGKAEAKIIRGYCEKNKNKNKTKQNILCAILILYTQFIDVTPLIGYKKVT